MLICSNWILLVLWEVKSKNIFHNIFTKSKLFICFNPKVNDIYSYKHLQEANIPMEIF